MKKLWISCALALGSLELPVAQGFPALEHKVDLQIWGDLYLPGFLMKNQRSAASGRTYFRELGSLLEGAELNIANLEGAVTRTAYPISLKKTFLFRMPSAIPELLKLMNINAVTLGNNHAMDFGLFGLVEMMGRLEKAGIKHTGAGENLASAIEPMVYDAPDGPVCIFSFSRTLPSSAWANSTRGGTAYTSFGRTRDIIRNAEMWCHATVAIFHWGQEATSKVKDYQIKLAKLVIDAGADAVVGHHPHVLQKVDYHRGVPIIYSVGNFVFGSAPFGSKPQGAMVRLAVLPTGKIELKSVVPIQVNNAIVNYRPRSLLRSEADELDPALFGPCKRAHNPERFLCSPPKGAKKQGA